LKNIQLRIVIDVAQIVNNFKINVNSFNYDLLNIYINNKLYMYVSICIIFIKIRHITITIINNLFCIISNNYNYILQTYSFPLTVFHQSISAILFDKHLNSFDKNVHIGIKLKHFLETKIT